VQPNSAVITIEKKQPAILPIASSDQMGEGGREGKTKKVGGSGSTEEVLVFTFRQCIDLRSPEGEGESRIR